MNKRHRAAAALFFLAPAALVCLDCSRDNPNRSHAGDASPAPPSASRASLAAITESLPLQVMPALNAETASRFVRLSLDCVDRPFPNKPSHVYDTAQMVRPPREITPSFFGCFDWHSAVHGHWAMVRVLRRFPELPEALDIRRALDAHLRAPLLSRELSFFREDRSKTFERPYGWGWLLRLAGELHQWNDDDARRWASAVRPLASFLAQRTIEYLPRLSVPIRAGTHANTAFALVHMLDYARTVGDDRLAKAIESRALDFYRKDRDCPTDYEPSGEDFISPCLVEADLMRRVLPPKEFDSWLDRFLPPFDSPRFRPLLRPVEVRDKKDPRIGHLIGLSLQRAWCMRGVARDLPRSDPKRTLLERSAQLHAHEAVGQMFESGYGGEHWLASFAVYLLTDEGDEKVPK